MSGSDNLWIVKPGGLSRGRNIKIFSDYHEVCQYAEIFCLTNNPTDLNNL